MSKGGVLFRLRPGTALYWEAKRQRRGLTPARRRFPLGGRPAYTPLRMISTWTFSRGRAG